MAPESGPINTLADALAELSAVLRTVKDSPTAMQDAIDAVFGPPRWREGASVAPAAGLGGSIGTLLLNAIIRYVEQHPDQIAELVTTLIGRLIERLRERHQPAAEIHPV